MKEYVQITHLVIQNLKLQYEFNRDLLFNIIINKVLIKIHYLLNLEDNVIHNSNGKLIKDDI